MRNFTLTFLLVLAAAPSICLAQNYGKNFNKSDEIRVPVGGGIEKEALTPTATTPISPKIIELHKLGVQYALKGQNKEAIAVFRQEIVEAPNLAVAHFNLAVALNNDGDIEETIKVLRNLLTIHPDYVKGVAFLGNILCQTNSAEEGIEKMRLAEKLGFSDLSSTMNLAGCLYKAKQYNEALELYEKAAVMKPDFAQIYNNQGAIFAALGKWDEALSSFRRSIELEPNFAESYNNMGVVLSALKKPKEAHEAYLKAYELRPKYNNAIYNLANSFLRMGDRLSTHKLLNQLKDIDAALAAKLQEKLLAKYVYKISAQN